MLDIKEIKKLAEEKADSQERRGCSAWNGLYYGYIFGYQDAQDKSLLYDSSLQLKGKVDLCCCPVIDQTSNAYCTTCGGKKGNWF